MRVLKFTDINGNSHSINVQTYFDSSIVVPSGFSHYMTVDNPFNVVGAINIMNIGDVFINEETGELKTILLIGAERFPLIGNLNL